jgi:hypothetical protein
MMSIQYRNDHFKIIPEDEMGSKFSGYKDHIVNDRLKVRERYIAGYILAIDYYMSQDENEDQIVEKLKDTPELKMLSVRRRESYGNFHIDHIKYFELGESQFSQLIIRELYNHRGQSIAWECTDPSLPSDDEFYYQLSKTYYRTENGDGGEYLISHYRLGVFTDIEYFSQGFQTDDQDVERGFYGIGAEELMSKMNIPSKMRAWYVNNEFLPVL